MPNWVLDWCQMAPWFSHLWPQGLWVKEIAFYSCRFVAQFLDEFLVTYNESALLAWRLRVSPKFCNSTSFYMFYIQVEKSRGVKEQEWRIWATELKICADDGVTWSMVSFLKDLSLTVLLWSHVLIFADWVELRSVFALGMAVGFMLVRYNFQNHSVTSRGSMGGAPCLQTSSWKACFLSFDW